LRPRRERLRCWTDHLAASGSHPQNRKATLVCSFRTEAENAIDARKARRVGENLFAETLSTLCLDKSDHQGNGVVRKRCSADRILPVTRAIACGEIAKSGLLGGRVPGAVEKFLGRNSGLVAP